MNLLDLVKTPGVVTRHGHHGNVKGSGTKHWLSDGTLKTVRELADDPRNVHGLTTKAIWYRIQCQKLDPDILFAPPSKSGGRKPKEPT